jgi:hypothetical protein
MPVYITLKVGEESFLKKNVTYFQCLKRLFSINI